MKGRLHWFCGGDSSRSNDDAPKQGRDGDGRTVTVTEERDGDGRTRRDAMTTLNTTMTLNARMSRDATAYGDDTRRSNNETQQRYGATTRREMQGRLYDMCINSKVYVEQCVY